MKPSLSVIAKSLGILCFAVSPSVILAQREAPSAASYYDEIFLDDGTVRPIYAESYAIFKKLTASERKTFAKKTYQDFSRDNTLHDMPRLMSETQIEFLRGAVKQRGEALLLFLQDHYSGKKTYESAGIFPPGTVDRIMRRTGEQYFNQRLNPNIIGFKYGPDIIHDKNDDFLFLEDNINAVGGDGDLILARESLFKRIPEYEQVLEISGKPDEYFSNLVRRFRELASPPNGAIVYYTDSVSVLADREVMRLREIFRKLGVITVSPRSDARIVVENDKVYVTRPAEDSTGIEKIRVGFFAVDGEPYEFDYSHPFCREKILISEAKRQIQYLAQIDADPSKLKSDALADYKFLKKNEKAVRETIQIIEAALNPDATGKLNFDALMTALSTNEMMHFDFKSDAALRPAGVFDLILNGTLPSNVGIGTEFIGDKEFYMYVDKLILFYLHEEPILKNIKTTSLATYDRKGNQSLNTDVLNLLKNSPATGVIKNTGGRGGDGVWIGAKMDRAAISRLIKKISVNPGDYILQPNTHLSVLGDLIVDTRLHGWIGRGGAVISRVPWGRGLPLSGDGKVNLGASGSEVAIIPVVDKTRNACLRIARKY